MPDETNPLQESMERSARLSNLFLPSPPRSVSYILILVAAGGTIPFLGANVDGGIDALLLVLAPSILASVTGPTATRVFGRVFYHRRSALLAAGGAALTAAGIAVGVVAGPLGVEPAKFVYGSVGLVWVLRYGIVYLIVDSRPAPALMLSAMHPLFALPGLVQEFGSGSLAAGLVLWAVLLLPVIVIVRLFDTPLQRNFGISASELFRAFLDHRTTMTSAPEELMERIGEAVDAPVAVVAFKRRDGTKKACIVVPTIHPGPFGALGGGDLPAKMRASLAPWEHVLVPHAAANHDLNPVTSQDVERLGHYAAELADRVETVRGGSKFVEAGETVRMGAQLFGPDALLTYSSWPEAIDDVDYGVGHAAELRAQAEGVRNAIFVDCHNSLRASAGAVFPLSPRALATEKVGGPAAAAALAARVPELEVGCAQDKSLGIEHLVGRAGCQALVVKAGEQVHAYVLWDGNNMVPEATRVVRAAVLEVVDEVRIMTTDNHAVNLEGGTYSPVGLRVSHERLARISKRAVEKAIEDLEPVTSGAACGHAPGIRVVGYQKTAQLSASVNTMISQLPELVLTCVGLWALGIAVVFLAF